MTCISRSLHKAFTAATEHTRQCLAQADIGRFELTLTSEGRTMTDRDECLLVYHLSAGWDCRVKGSDLDECIKEVMRRHGWDARNAPKALPSPV